jgi:SAM-dependent methyltransferase
MTQDFLHVPDRQCRVSRFRSTPCGSQEQSPILVQPVRGGKQTETGLNLRSLVWKYFPRQIMTFYADRTILRLPDRVYMTDVIIPKIIERRPKSVLNLGVHYYTDKMQGTLAEAGVDVFTADPDGRKTRWGSAGKHRICKAGDVEGAFPGVTFDVVILNGVLGYGLDTQAEFNRTLRAIATKLNPGGLLVLGWDDNMFHDPLADGAHLDLFVDDASLLGAHRVPQVNGLLDTNGKPATKNYDVLRRL